MHRTLAAIVALLVLLFAEPLHAGNDEAPPKDEADLEQRLRAILKEHRIPGLGVSLVDVKGVRWAKGLGKANVKTGAEMTPDTLLRVGSVSKMWAALAALRLSHEGRLDLAARVQDLAPEIQIDNPWEATDPVRVVHLLEHTTGWDDWTARGFDHDDPKPVTLKEGLDFDPRSRVSRWRPGTRFTYSNSGPGVTAYIVEKITKKRYEDYVAETFFAPLGMKTATFLWSPETDSRLTRLYASDGVTELPYWHVILRPAGSLNASANEMAKLVSLLLHRGTSGETAILPASAIDRMETPTTDLGARAGLTSLYGLHNFGLMREEGFVWRGHTGAFSGTRAELFYLPEAGVGYFFAQNAGDAGAARSIGELIRAYLTKDLPKPPLPKVAIPGDAALAYAGFYEPVSIRYEPIHFFIRLLGMGRVKVSKQGLTVTSPLGFIAGNFIAVSDTLYRRPEDPAPSLALLPVGADGRMIQIGGMTVRAMPTWLALVQIALFVLAMLAVVSTALFALVWIPRRLFGRMKDVKHLSLRVPPLLSVLALAGTVWLLTMNFVGEYPEPRFGIRTFWSMSLTACSVLFAIFSVLSLVGIARAPRKEVHRFAFAHTLFASVMMGVIAVYLGSWGVIGIRTWAP